MVPVATSSSGVTVTVPAEASVAFAIGTVVNVYNAGSAAITVAGASGVTVRNGGLVAPYQEVSLRKRRLGMAGFGGGGTGGGVRGGIPDPSFSFLRKASPIRLNFVLPPAAGWPGEPILR